MADTQRTETRKVPSVEFRTQFGKYTEPVDVTVLGRVIGHWYPAGVPLAWQHGGVLPRVAVSVDGATQEVSVESLPTSRSAPVIPSGEYPAVGTAETDRAQSGVPDAVVQPVEQSRPSDEAATLHVAGSSPARVPAPYEPEGESLHSPSSGSSLSHVPTTGEEGREMPLDEFLDQMGSRIEHVAMLPEVTITPEVLAALPPPTARLLPRSIIPPKPAGYLHDPHFNSKGSRPAPKVRGR